MRIWLISMLIAGTTLISRAQTFEEYMKLGDEFYAARNYKEAIFNFTLAIGLQPNSSKGYWYRGDCYRETKEYEKAITDYEIAVDL